MESVSLDAEAKFEVDPSEIELDQEYIKNSGHSRC